MYHADKRPTPTDAKENINIFDNSLIFQAQWINQIKPTSCFVYWWDEIVPKIRFR